MSGDREDAWIIKRVPEATTDEVRLTLYAIGRHLRMMMDFAHGCASPTTPTDEMRATSRNKASASVVKAWDDLMEAMAEHPTYELIDHIRACDRNGVDLAEAEKYAKALREIVDEYRKPLPVPRGQGAPRRQRDEALHHAVGMVESLLGVSLGRASAIVADMATELLGADRVYADSLSKAIGKHREREKSKERSQPNRQGFVP